MLMKSTLLAALVGTSSVLAIKCSLESQCPEESPCCSVYGECGVGAFCLGGCDPRMSFSLDSCVPAPVCQDYKKTWNNPNKLEDITDISKYLGDSDKSPWVSQGEPVPTKDGVLLSMPRQSVGTVISSTAYMWYGNIKARIRTSRGRGVVTAFILFSDVKDEIDYEWVGVDLETAQTNFYFQGIPNYNNSGNISLSDTFSMWHDYEIRWTPDKIDWVVDGQVGRSAKREDHWNKTTSQWEFPQTPARVQLSIWPGGLPSNAEGTINWAGGEIDWDHPDVKDGKYFYAAVSDVEIQCYQGRDGLGTNDKTSYIYTDDAGTNNGVVDSDKDHILASFQGTGTDMDRGKKEDDSRPSNVATIPGGSNANSEHEHGDGSHDDDESGDSGNSIGGGSGTGDQGSSSAPSDDIDRSKCAVGDFNMDCRADGAKEDGGGSGSGKSSASMLAIIIAGCALYWL